MQLHELQRNNPNRKAKRIGRGGKRGKTSGKGHKGQKQHAGGAGRPEMRDLIKKLPKRRGYGINRARTVDADTPKPLAVNVSAIEKHFENGDTVNPEALVTKGVVKRQRGRAPKVKILSRGTLTKKCTFEKCLFSKAAAEKITKAGGTMVA